MLLSAGPSQGTSHVSTLQSLCPGHVPASPAFSGNSESHAIVFSLLPASLWKSVIFPVSPHGHKWQGRNLITVIGGLPRGRGGHLNTREN